MNPVQEPDSYGSADYTGVLRRRWWIVLVLAVIGLVGALAYTQVAAKQYTAMAAVFVAPTAADNGNAAANSRTAGTVNLDTEAQIVTSGTVAARAAHLFHTSLTPYELSKSVSVTVPPNSEVLDISCSASSATASAACAQAFATAYLQNRSSTAASSLNAQITTLQHKTNALQHAANTLNTKLSALPKNSSKKISDRQALGFDQNQLRSLESRIGGLTGESSNTSGGHIITAASPPGKPSSPKKLVVLPSGLVAGLLIGLIAAFVWDRRDKRLHGATDVERLLGIPVMLDLSRSTFGRQASLASPRSRTGQAFTELAHSVAASLGEGSHVLLVTGATAGPGGSVTAANLAATLARTHSEVVLVCADLKDTVAPEMFGLSESRGLAEVAAGSATVSEVARGPAGVPGLWVIPPGAERSFAQYSMQHDTARALTSQLRREARYVIIEVSATEDGADTFALAEFTDAALLVVEASRTTRTEADACIRRLARRRTPVLGAAVLPSIAAQFSVRPPRPGQTRLGAEQADGRNGAVSGRGHDEPSALSRSAVAADGLDRPVASREGYGNPADRASGR